MIALVQSNYVPRLPLGNWVESFVQFTTNNFTGFFDLLQSLFNFLVGAGEGLLTILPAPLMILVFGAVAWVLANWRIALLTLAGFLLILSLQLWGDAMTTLALVLASTFVALLLGVPMGILAAQYRIVEVIVRPVLDFMQTMPAFVYLLPAVILLGLGSAPALIAVVVFAMPPAVRLTLLGIQQVPAETVEAAHAFGASPWQTLIKVELPLAIETIMAGVNQVIMLALSMVVIAALIGAGGLGDPVYQGLSRLDIGLSFEGGIGIVVIAIVLDRITRRIGVSSSPAGKGGTA
ncbi:proline/glycine betaine ABC transporter permease [soil metagenome]